MNNKAISCCFSGHRKTHFDMDASYMGDILQDALKSAIQDAVSAGFTTFYTGMAMGFDIIAAEIILQQKYVVATDISLMAVVPFKGQELKFSKNWRSRHDNVLRGVDKIIVLNPQYIQGCYHERNRYLVDHSARLIGLHSEKTGGTKHTFDYAEKSDIQIINLWPNIAAQDPLKNL